MEKERSDLSGRRLSRKLTQTLAAWKLSARAAWTKLRELPWGELLFYGAMLIGLVWLLTACAVPSTLPTEPAMNPQTPQLSEPLPLENYSKSAAERIKSWAERLMGM